MENGLAQVVLLHLQPPLGRCIQPSKKFPPWKDIKTLINKKNLFFIFLSFAWAGARSLAVLLGIATAGILFQVFAWFSWSNSPSV
ncbi:Hypothetical protein Minf_0044 [Methylacidiphilum infernorum V4]|uniref:Uncharacterized protein n=1 Tax=Methylacidiphilum infernorum (isolate V4) TaxID=481448 RepID=B3DWW4_METI4|nr:Hypothetical protein Minf_0044 [Methylacidiphilum infernorum V4]